MSEKLEFIVPDEYDSKKAIAFLRKHCNLSARMITQLKRKKDGILMDGKILRTVDFTQAGSRVEINLPDEESEIVPVEGRLDIAFEDLTYPLRSQLGQDFLYYDLKVYRLCPACREKLKDFHKNKKQEESEC